MLSQIEQDLITSVSKLLGPWIDQVRRQQSDEERIAFRRQFARFADWVAFYSLRPPVNGYVIAGYLLELVSSGAGLDDVNEAAEAIRFTYALRRVPLDLEPINAALALAAAQLSPGRTLH
jgi:hypothetical protein